MRLALYGFALLLASLGFSQQQAQQPPSLPPSYPSLTFPEVPQMPPDHKAPPPQSLSTAEVVQQIQEHFSTEPALANTNVGVKVDESLVILTGTVDSDTQHDLALRIVHSYAGDRTIVDNIQVPQ